MTECSKGSDDYERDNRPADHGVLILQRILRSLLIMGNFILKRSISKSVLWNKKEKEQLVLPLT